MGLPRKWPRRGAATCERAQLPNQSRARGGCRKLRVACQTPGAQRRLMGRQSRSTGGWRETPCTVPSRLPSLS